MTNQKVDEIDRSIYDFRYEEDDFYRIQSGLTPEIVEKISEEKHDPEWMRQFRLKCLDIYNRIPVPRWGRHSDLCQGQYGHEKVLGRRSGGYQGYL